MEYEQSKRLASDPNPRVRGELAATPDIRPELLYFLASDVEAYVRAIVAGNVSTPRHADVVLASDKDDGVRASLADKIARLVPTLPADQKDQLTAMTLQVLEKLAQDHVERVRSVISEALKHMPEAPGGIVRRLARDTASSVASPLLEHSPLLTDEDLVDIIAQSPAKGSLSAIARRGSVTGVVADAIANSDDAQAIATLLANPKAQIREQTLDQIIERAPEHEPWHAPLVRRPSLPLRAIRRLAEFVSDSLVKALQERPDVDAETAAALGETVKRRLVAEPKGIADEQGGSSRARRLAEEGKLSELEMVSAQERGDRPFLLAGLAALAQCPDKTAEDIMSSSNGKVIMGLCWKAGLSARFAHSIQLKVARIPPREVMNLRGGTQYPISKAQMMWELEGYGIR
jgi:uncharacterized protein (DUF2336 family)